MRHILSVAPPPWPRLRVLLDVSLVAQLLLVHRAVQRAHFLPQLIHLVLRILVLAPVVLRGALKLMALVLEHTHARVLSHVRLNRRGRRHPEGSLLLLLLFQRVQQPALRSGERDARVGQLLTLLLNRALELCLGRLELGCIQLKPLHLGAKFGDFAVVLLDLAVAHDLQGGGLAELQAQVLDCALGRFILLHFLVSFSHVAEPLRRALRQQAILVCLLAPLPCLSPTLFQLR
mmetsp:Transcript_33391/g.79596  ORF Transcript_33391/g.79596 Transcript_33391/m.79596 type:complete len:233 (-) Transcript_33391:252-950(-)